MDRRTPNEFLLELAHQNLSKQADAVLEAQKGVADSTRRLESAHVDLARAVARLKYAQAAVEKEKK